MGSSAISAGDAIRRGSRPHQSPRAGAFAVSVGATGPRDKEAIMGCTIEGCEVGPWSEQRFCGHRAKELYEASLEGAHDAEAGDVQDGHWYALFAEAGIILQVDSSGFVFAADYVDEPTVRRFWDELIEAVDGAAEREI